MATSRMCQLAWLCACEVLGVHSNFQSKYSHDPNLDLLEQNHLKTKFKYVLQFWNSWLTLPENPPKIYYWRLCHRLILFFYQVRKPCITFLSPFPFLLFSICEFYALQILNEANILITRCVNAICFNLVLIICLNSIRFTLSQFVTSPLWFVSEYSKVFAHSEMG